MTAMDSHYSVASNTLGKKIERIGLALAILATVAVLLRLLARWKSKASFAGDDLMIILSLFPFYGMTAISYLGSSVPICRAATTDLGSGQPGPFRNARNHLGTGESSDASEGD